MNESRASVYLTDMHSSGGKMSSILTELGSESSGSVWKQVFATHFRNSWEDSLIFEMTYLFFGIFTIFHVSQDHVINIDRS